MPDYLASHLLIDQLAAEGTRFIFGTLGSAQSPIIQAALEMRSDTHYLAGLHEHIAGSMAVGYAQASGRPGVVSLPAATGLLNGLASLYDAKHSRVPLIVLGDQQDTQILNDEPPLSGDLCALAKTLCKWTCELRTVTEIPRVIRRAFHEALSPPKGPVLIALPINILLKPTTARSIPVPQMSPLGGAESTFVKKAAAKLVAAKRPCIIAGNEISQYGARREAVTLAEVLGCPVFCEPLPTGVNFPNRHAHFAGVLPLDLYQASRLLNGYDCFLVLGMQTRLPAKAQEPPLIPSQHCVIQINVEPGLAGRSLPNEMCANADLCESLSRLRAEIQLIVDSGWVNAARDRAADTIHDLTMRRQALEDTLTYPGQSDPIPLIWLLRMLDALRPLSSIIVNDLVATAPHPMEVLTLESSSSYYSSNGGSIGYGAAAAMGVQWASPESSVICITADESALYHPQAFWTAAHYGLRVKFIVVNTMGRRNFGLNLAPVPSERGRVLIDNPHISIPELARSMRVPSMSIADMGGLESGLRKMFETPGPFVLDVHIETETGPQ
jgi:benzoylformate decarboxylase